ncbi:hypothetical protein [Streptomyces rimosus]|uniref:hypothetical protein n=1 Tax=Streptomyces rimosus TaxID=1927 RepID=UPI0004C6DB8C|nr:hypothetical protein [Streptomyces rimosus]
MIRTTNQAHIRHALHALAGKSQLEREGILKLAVPYLEQIDQLRPPIWSHVFILDSSANQIDAFDMRFGATLARALGLAVTKYDRTFPNTLRAVVAAINAPDDALCRLATTTCCPMAIARQHTAVGGFERGAGTDQSRDDHAVNIVLDHKPGEADAAGVVHQLLVWAPETGAWRCLDSDGDPDELETRAQALRDDEGLDQNYIRIAAVVYTIRGV